MAVGVNSVPKSAVRTHLDEDLTVLGMLELDVLESEGLALLFKDGRLVRLGKRRHDFGIDQRD